MNPVKNETKLPFHFPYDYLITNANEKCENLLPSHSMEAIANKSQTHRIVIVSIRTVFTYIFHLIH